MWGITERENQRGRDRIVGGITEGVFRRDFPGIGKEAVRIRIILLREFLHIEGQKFSLHHDGAILSRHDRACNVRAAPVPLGGIGIGRLCTTSCQQQEQQDSRSYFLFHIYRLLSFEFRLYLPHRPLIIKIFSGIRTAAVWHEGLKYVCCKSHKGCKHKHRSIHISYFSNCLLKNRIGLFPEEISFLPAA